MRALQSAALRPLLTGEDAGARPAPTAVTRLVVVCREDPGGRYAWLGPPRAGDVLVAFDGLAHADLAGRGALLFERLRSWEERSAEERYVNELLAAVRAHPQVAALERGGHRLIDFTAERLRAELTRLLRGWALRRAAPGAERLLCDPATPPALQMGARAALGLDPAAVPYAPPPALAGSPLERALARPVMRAVAARSRPGRVRVAAVATGKLALALAALPGAELRDVGVGTMPFPGLDYGNSALLALRRRLPMLATYDRPARRGRPAPGGGADVGLSARLGLCAEAPLDRVLSLLVARLLTAAAPELDGVARVLAGLERARALRAVVLPTAGCGAAQLLAEWAHRRDLQVGVMQHGIYAFRTGCDDAAGDVIFSWGEGTAEQARHWPAPRPRLVQVGVPGTPVASPRSVESPLRRVLVAATGTGVDTPLASLASCEEYLDVLAPGLAALATAGSCGCGRTQRVSARATGACSPAAGCRSPSPRAAPSRAAAAWADLVLASGLFRGLRGGGARPAGPAVAGRRLPRAVREEARASLVDRAPAGDVQHRPRSSARSSRSCWRSRRQPRRSARAARAAGALRPAVRRGRVRRGAPPYRLPGA